MKPEFAVKRDVSGLFALLVLARRKGGERYASARSRGKTSASSVARCVASPATRRGARHRLFQKEYCDDGGVGGGSAYLYRRAARCGVSRVLRRKNAHLPVLRAGGGVCAQEYPLFLHFGTNGGAVFQNRTYERVGALVHHLFGVDADRQRYGVAHLLAARLFCAVLHG